VVLPAQPGGKLPETEAKATASVAAAVACFNLNRRINGDYFCWELRSVTLASAISLLR
jgi:hypothetical protein